MKVPEWEEDQNVLVVIDVPGQTPDDVLGYFVALRDKVNTAYSEAGELQKSLWITMQLLIILKDD